MAGKVALVTGASSGIGEATASSLLDLGYEVWAGARRIPRMDGLAARGAHVLEMDLTDEASLARGIERIGRESASGGVDVLVNNAGYGSYGALEDVPIAEARRQFEVNVFGVARLTQLVLPHMRASRSGRIVNVSSIGGKVYEPLGGWYHATKFALEGLSDSLRTELKPFGIEVVVVEPGAISTEWGAVAAAHLREASGSTAYRAQAQAVAAMLESAGASTRFASPPSVVAEAIVSAIGARRPKTRYVAGNGARAILGLRRILPDRAFDAAIALALRSAARTPNR